MSPPHTVQWWFEGVGCFLQDCKEQIVLQLNWDKKGWILDFGKAAFSASAGQNSLEADTNNQVGNYSVSLVRQMKTSQSFPPLSLSEH